MAAKKTSLSPDKQKTFRIEIKPDVYARLQAEKRKNESFSALIQRLLQKKTVIRITRITDPKIVAELEKSLERGIEAGEFVRAKSCHDLLQ